ncbi:hypothetical protein EGI22_03440 [Lacihabitans sp. LS3-19]|uniref:hypothetical protein n=1 Tax=Lacihabitans sp. LS3-19 TaxID=2487335 RepID=UPI0020CF72A8|nr:hypothetical protein [Lacihabitans sp. LS3-19]MCP9766948.1 hypothetical protein [Lacihabitans sp. LS3-19]
MKKIILSIGLGLVVTYASAQVVNSTKLYIAEGAVVSLGSDVTNNGEITNNGKLHLKGDLKNNAKLVSKGEVNFDGQSPQTVSGTTKAEMSRIAVENDINLQTPVSVSDEVSFRKGIVSTYNESGLELGENATTSGASDMSHVAGVMSKTGNGSFEFPVGDGTNLKSFEVSKMNGKTLEAKYVANNPMDVSADLDYDVESINQTEYWVLKSNDNSSVDVSLKDKSDVAYLKSGVWVKDNSRINVSSGNKDGAMFTSGTGRNITKEIGVWPNPTQGEFNLKLTGMRDTDNISVDLTNQDGRVVMKMSGTVRELRKAYTLPNGMVTTNLTVRVINGTEAMTQSLILNR